MSAILPLRDYQRAAISALHNKWDAGIQRPAVVLPTGAGKTVVFAHLVKEWTVLNPGKRVLILVHTDELVSQAVKKLHDVAPHLRVGVVKGKRNEVFSDIIVASVQSLRSKKRRAQLRRVGLGIVDECHHATAPTYRAIMEHFPEAFWAGFTATLARGDGESLADVWQQVAYRQDILFMIRRHFLINVRGKRVEVDDLDLKRVKRSGADFQAADLGEALEASLAPEIVAKAYVEHASDRSGILFAPTVSAAYVFADELNSRGVKTEVVHGGLATGERRAILQRLQDGVTQVVSNCMVLTEGFDSPRISCIVVARPTKSAPLYQQMVGRGLRVDHTRAWEDQDCLILDVVGVSQIHGLASLVDLTEKRIPLKEDQLLTDAEEELTSEGIEQRDKGYVSGPTKVTEFDPLAGMSKFVWNKTTGGVWYISAGVGKGSRYVYVAPGGVPASYSLGWVTQSHTDFIDGKRGGFALVEGEPVKNVDLETAFAWGESLFGGWALSSENYVSQAKTATWRRSEPSEAQLYKAKTYRIKIPEGATRGLVSQLIDNAVASPRVDAAARVLTDMSKERTEDND